MVPPTLYLLSFILAFASPRRGSAGAALPLPTAIVATLPAAMALPTVVPHWATFLIHLATFFLAATACHAELARRRPPTCRLTDFYLDDRSRRRAWRGCSTP